MENVLFKQTFRGFNRGQVLEYIDNISARMTQQAEEYSNIQKGLEDEIQSLSRRLSESKENLTLSRETTRKLQEELEFLKLNNGELKRRVTAYRNMIQIRDKQISDIKSDYEKLSRRSQTLERENADWKSKQDEIANCMVEANLRAKQIIRDAHAEAERNKARFDTNAANLMEKVGDVRMEIGRLENELEESFTKLANVIEAMDKASAGIEDQVKEYYNKVDKLNELPPKQAPVQQVQQPVTTVKEKTVPVRRMKPVERKPSLTESVLDTIAKLLDK